METLKKNDKTKNKSGNSSQQARERMLERYNLNKKELTPQEARERMLQKRGYGQI